MLVSDSLNLTEDEFYSRRGDRMRRLAPNLRYQETPVSVVATPDTAGTHLGQVMILATVNLLARWARKIDVYVPNHQLLIPSLGDETLQDRVKSEVRQADPFNGLHFRSPRSDALILQVGRETPASLSPDYAVASDGWDAVGWRPGQDNVSWSTTEEHFIPAAQFASCLGVAQTFKQATGQSEKKWFEGIRWRMWNYEILPVDEGAQQSCPSISSARFDLGRILQVGIGAVGSNVLYFLAQTGIEADLTAIDYDKVELENLDRSLLFGIDHVLGSGAGSTDSGMKKAYAAQEALVTSDRLAITPFVGSWNEFVEKRLSAEQYDVWLALANEEGAWNSMAKNFPPLVLQSTTSHDWRITLGRHVPLLEYCLRCRFQPSTWRIFRVS